MLSAKVCLAAPVDTFTTTATSMEEPQTDDTKPTDTVGLDGVTAELGNVIKQTETIFNGTGIGDNLKPTVATVHTSNVTDAIQAVHDVTPDTKIEIHEISNRIPQASLFNIGSNIIFQNILKIKFCTLTKSSFFDCALNVVRELGEAANLAISQKLGTRAPGLSPVIDLLPWQKLSKEEQHHLQQYLALRPELQDFTKSQKSILNIFLGLDPETVSEAIESELMKQNEEVEQHKQMIEGEMINDKGKVPTLATYQNIAEKRQRSLYVKQNKKKQVQRRTQEKPSNLNFERQRPNYDPRKPQLQFQRKLSNKNPQDQFLKQRQFNLNTVETLHFQQAEDLLVESIRLQGCLVNPATCQSKAF